MDVRVGWLRRLSAEELMLLNCGIGESLGLKEIQLVHPKGDQSWVFVGRTNVEAETPILWPPHAKSWLIGKDPNAWKDWGQEEKGTTEDEMAGWHHRLNGHGFGWTPGVGDGQGGLACCVAKSWTRLSNWTELKGIRSAKGGHVWQILHRLLRTSLRSYHLSKYLKEMISVILPLGEEHSRHRV